MKNFKRVLIGMSALVLLTACGGQKVSKEKFQEKIDALEEHAYSEAVVKYESKRSGTTEKNEKGEVKFNYVAGVWVAEDLTKEAYGAFLYSIRGQKVHDDSEANGFKYQYKYYINPLKVVYTETGEKKNDDDNFSKLNNKYSTTMDKYGFVTAYSASIDEHTKGSAFGVSAEVKIKGTDKISISYK